MLLSIFKYSMVRSIATPKFMTLPQNANFRWKWVCVCLCVCVSVCVFFVFFWFGLVWGFLVCFTCVLVWFVWFFFCSKGYVQGSMWQLLNTDIPSSLVVSQWRQITVLPGHVIMWSVLRLRINIYDEVYRDHLRVYVGGRSSSDLVWQAEGVVTPEPVVHNTSTVFVYVSEEAGMRFRLIFSFHTVSILVLNTSTPVVNVCWHKNGEEIICMIQKWRREREGERERERQRQRQTDRQTDRQTRESKREREREGGTGREGGGEREREADRQTDR